MHGEGERKGKGNEKGGNKKSGKRRRTKGLPTLKVASSEPVQHLLYVISISRTVQSGLHGVKSTRYVLFDKSRPTYYVKKKFYFTVYISYNKTESIDISYEREERDLLMRVK